MPDITIVTADTDTCPYDLGTRASRMTYICGEAVRRAAATLANSIRVAAALEMNDDVSEVQLDAGAACGADGRRLALTDIAARLLSRDAPLPSATEVYRAAANPSSYAAHFAEVEVDTLTGCVRVTDFLAAHDLGRFRRSA